MSGEDSAKLDLIGYKLDALTESFETHQDQMREDHREIKLAIHGDGSDGNPGLQRRVERLETKASLLTWALGLTGLGGTSLGGWILSKWGNQP